MLFTSPLNESFSNSSTLNNSSFIFSNATQSSLNIDFLNQNLKTTWDAFIVFLYITIGVLSISLIRTVMFFTFAIKASSSIHKGLINAILRSKMSFFNQNPLGK